MNATPRIVARTLLLAAALLAALPLAAERSGRSTAETVSR